MHDRLPYWLQIYLYVYAALAIFHILLQMLLAHIEWRKQKKLHVENYVLPSVTIIIPVFNEDDDVFRRCVESAHSQDYPDLQVIVVDDGSAEQEHHHLVADSFHDQEHIEFVALPDNVGKRNTQTAVLDRIRGEITVTVDSDTILTDPQTLRKLVRRFSDPNVGVITGDVRVENSDVNMLTRLISLRYWMAFNQERAAQSLFGVMLCASGPLAAYRTAEFRRVARRYTNQKFLGQTCTFGDDRHLTNLMLANGHEAIYEHTAIACTHVPTNIKQYVRQQLRWNKSFYREFFWTIRFMFKRHPYMAFDLIVQAVLPFMLMVALALVVYQAVAIDASKVWHYALIVLGIGLLRSAYGAIRQRDPRFLLFMVYGFIHVLVLMPTRLVALSTLRTTKWGTR